jgi:hypothetical protein
MHYTKVRTFISYMHTCGHTCTAMHYNKVLSLLSGVAVIKMCVYKERELAQLAHGFFIDGKESSDYTGMLAPVSTQTDAVASSIDAVASSMNAVASSIDTVASSIDAVASSIDAVASSIDAVAYSAPDVNITTLPRQQRNICGRIWREAGLLWREIIHVACQIARVRLLGIRDSEAEGPTTHHVLPDHQSQWPAYRGMTILSLKQIIPDFSAWAAYPGMLIESVLGDMMLHIPDFVASVPDFGLFPDFGNLFHTEIDISDPFDSMLTAASWGGVRFPGAQNHNNNENLLDWNTRERGRNQREKCVRWTCTAVVRRRL